MMHAMGLRVPMHDGVWTIVGRAFVTTTQGQLEVYTLTRGEYEMRLTRHELDANKVTMH